MQWRQNKFENGGHTSGAKCQKNFVAPLHFLYKYS